MSLINDALKKAERMRREQAGQTESTAAPEAGPSRKQKVSQTGRLIAIVAGAAVLVCASVFITLRIVNKPVAAIAVPQSKHVLDTAGTAPSVVSAKPAPSQPPVLIEAKPAPKVAPAVKVAKAQAPLIVMPGSIVPPTQPPPATIASNAPANAAPIIASTPGSGPQISLDAVTDPTAVPPASQNAKGSPQVQAFVNNLRILGIRADGKESRVLINDRVYRVDDIIDRSTGLRLVEVRNDRLVFVDPFGVRYIRNF